MNASRKEGCQRIVVSVPKFAPAWKSYSEKGITNDIHYLLVEIQKKMNSLFEEFDVGSVCAFGPTLKTDQSYVGSARTFDPTLSKSSVLAPLVGVGNT